MSFCARHFFVAQFSFKQRTCCGTGKIFFPISGYNEYIENAFCASRIFAPVLSETLFKISKFFIIKFSSIK